jgi:hypothetical protein
MCSLASAAKAASGGPFGWLATAVASRIVFARFHLGTAICRFGTNGFGLRQFSTDNSHFARGLDADPHRLTFDAQDRDDNVLADLNLLRRLPRENQHGLLLG